MPSGWLPSHSSEPARQARAATATSGATAATSARSTAGATTRCADRDRRGDADLSERRSGRSPGQHPGRSVGVHARYFFGRLNAAYATGQTGLLRPLGTAKCTGCGTLEDEAAAVTSGGRHTVSEPMLLREVTASNEPHIEGQTPVDVLFRLRATKIVDSAGAAAGTLAEKNGILSRVTAA